MHRYLTAAFLMLAALPLSAQVVINEVVYDDSGTDDREFVEIYNAGTGIVDISGWTLENRDNGGLSLMGLATVPLLTFLAPGDFYTFGNTLVGTQVPNPFNFQTIPVNALENDFEVCILRDLTLAVVDSLAYEANLQTVGAPYALIEGTGVWGNATSLDVFPSSWSRYQDGVDTNDNGRDFGMLAATPGATNNVAINPTPYVNNFDLAPAETLIPGFGQSFVGPFAVDPTVGSAHNPGGSVIVASPQGGNCMTLMDPTGGGTMAWFLSTASSNFSFDAYVYCGFAGTLSATEYETWSIGVRGTTDTFHNHPQLSPTLPPPPVAPGQNANGNTGIAWEYLATMTGGTLSLVAEGNGGADEVILATYNIAAPGWQRLRIVVADDVIDANFGGTLGVANSGARTLTLSNYAGLGTFYMGYREFLTNNANMRPLTIDDMTLLIGAAVPVPFSAHLVSDAIATGSLINRGLNNGIETWNILSLEACPGGVGTGPYLGLCATNFNDLLNQYLYPLGAAPFHFLAVGSTYDLLNVGLPSTLHLEVLLFDALGNIAPVDAVDIL